MKVVDVMANGAKVYGVVNMINSFKLKKYDDGLVCTSDCYVRNENSAMPICIYSREKETEQLIKYDYKKYYPDYLWHLVTDTGYISCGNKELLDYNYNIDIHL